MSSSSTPTAMTPQQFFSEYASELGRCLHDFDWAALVPLVDVLNEIRRSKKSLFICGNGGSSANADHFANDFIYGISQAGEGIHAISLSSNSAVLSCLANDRSYADVFSWQIKNAAQAGDGLMVLSGSGNSPNIIAAISEAKKLGLCTMGILGFDGGACKALLDYPVHFPVNDMQKSEDLQQVVGHMLTRALSERIRS
tara:strand:+ start:2880 stop:3473 length:594 start_codon:yes stop_codon:yes gene_type:complete